MYLQELKGMQLLNQYVKGKPFVNKGKGYLVCQKWYKKG